MEKPALRPSYEGRITEVLSVDFDGSGIAAYAPFFKHFTDKVLVIITRPVADNTVLLQHITDNIETYRRELPFIPAGTFFNIQQYFLHAATIEENRQAIEMFCSLFYQSYAGRYKLIFTNQPPAA